jgi:hypothetical protein
MHLLKEGVDDQFSEKISWLWGHLGVQGFWVQGNKNSRVCGGGLLFLGFEAHVHIFA